MKKRFSVLGKLAIVMALPILMGAVVLTDPTKPPGFMGNKSSSNTTQQPLTLKATYNYPNVKFAIINDQIVKQGDAVSEFTVTTITTDTVELVSSNNKIILQLVPSVKTKAF